MEWPTWLWLVEKCRKISKVLNDVQKGKISATAQVGFVLCSMTHWNTLINALNYYKQYAYIYSMAIMQVLLYPHYKNSSSRGDPNDLKGSAAWPLALALEALNAVIDVAITLPEFMIKISIRAWLYRNRSVPLSTNIQNFFFLTIHWVRISTQYMDLILLNCHMGCRVCSSLIYLFS